MPKPRQCSTLAATFIRNYFMIEEINFGDLQNRFTEIKKLYPLNKQKYIHANTITNFLTHANEFFMKNDQQEIHKTLSEYFDILNSTKIENVTESLQVFNKYIKPLTLLYSDLRGFHMAIRLWVLFISSIAIFFLLYLLKATTYFYIGTFALALFFVARQLYFKSRQKTYGFMH